MAEISTLPLYNDSALQEYYRLEDLTGKNGNTLTNNNSATFVGAKFGNGVSGGSSDANKSLSIASRLGYNGGAYAISFWVKINVVPSGGQYIFCSISDDTTSNSRLVIFYNDNAGTRELYSQRIRVGTAGDAGVSYPVELGTTDFHHIILSYDGSTVKLYLDGVERQSYSSSGSGATDITNLFTILEGSTSGSDSSLAIIDDFALFNRALTVSEVNQIYQAGGAGFFNFL